LTTDPVVLEFRGRIPSSKNRYTPRKDKPGFFKNSKLQDELDRIALQIPGWARDLKLENPEISVHFKYTTANWDRTNAWQGLEDLLVSYGVLRNDNIRRSNSLISLHPAEKSDYDGVKVILIPRAEATSSPRYVRPPRRRSLAPIPVILNDKTTPEEDDLPDLIEGVEWGD